VSEKKIIGFFCGEKFLGVYCAAVSWTCFHGNWINARIYTSMACAGHNEANIELQNAILWQTETRRRMSIFVFFGEPDFCIDTETAQNEEKGSAKGAVRKIYIFVAFISRRVAEEKLFFDTSFSQRRTGSSFQRLSFLSILWVLAPCWKTSQCQQVFIYINGVKCCWTKRCKAKFPRHSFVSFGKGNEREFFTGERKSQKIPFSIITAWIISSALQKTAQDTFTKNHLCAPKETEKHFTAENSLFTQGEWTISAHFCGVREIKGLVNNHIFH